MNEARPVFICERCGRGFIVRPREGRDPWPEWVMLDKQGSGFPCGGEIETKWIPRE